MFSFISGLNCAFIFLVQVILDGFMSAGATAFCMTIMYWELFSVHGKNSGRLSRGKKLR